jgi:hypothetical protein
VGFLLAPNVEPLTKACRAILMDIESISAIGACALSTSATIRQNRLAAIHLIREKSTPLARSIHEFANLSTYFCPP